MIKLILEASTDLDSIDISAVKLTQGELGGGPPLPITERNIPPY